MVKSKMTLTEIQTLINMKERILFSSGTKATVKTYDYRAFRRFGQAKFAYGGSILSSSQFTLLPQLPLKTTLNLKVVQIDFENNHLTSLI